METNVDNIKRFFESVKVLNFWGRLFGWSKIKNQLVEARADLERLLANLSNTEIRLTTAELSIANTNKDLSVIREDNVKKQSEIDRLMLAAKEDATTLQTLRSGLDTATANLNGQVNQNKDLSHHNDLLQQKNEYQTGEIKRLSEREAAQMQEIGSLTKRKGELDTEMIEIKNGLEATQKDLKAASEQLILHQSKEERQRQEHQEQLATLSQIQGKIQADREQEIRDRHDAELTRLERMKGTWVHHQDTVKQALKSLCSKHTIDYVDKVAFKGEPDNTLSIAGEFIVFDAKSPRGEDLSNFPNYVKEQTEKAKKYAQEENVKKWIFFVVPSNTLEVIKTFVYHLADYHVFVVTIDALEPILLSLKKVEEYEWADQLSPEDRESICRILGKFAHLSKRRIQIDTYFINQFMELAYKCENDLPADVLEKAIEFEKAEKLNPPVERRAKAISTTELERSLKKAQQDAASKGISIDLSRLAQGLNDVPLYTTE